MGHLLLFSFHSFLSHSTHKTSCMSPPPIISEGIYDVSRGKRGSAKESEENTKENQTVLVVIVISRRKFSFWETTRRKEQCM